MKSNICFSQFQIIKKKDFSPPELPVKEILHHLKNKQILTK